MPDVRIREVICLQCSCRTSQRLSTLEPILWLQALASEDGIYINYACPTCGKLTRSLVESVTTLPKVDSAKCHGDLTTYVVFLKCEKSGCESPVIVLAPVKNTFREADLAAHIRKNWATHDAACAKGHPPARPYESHIWKQLVSEP
ncbi:MAG TPA: hypothetical protein VJN92_17145 [Candidatus Acidoferrum sp.]|nr:hypothetical protein [Candidatus Acidoferrum sp.]